MVLSSFLHSSCNIFLAAVLAVVVDRLRLRRPRPTGTVVATSVALFDAFLVFVVVVIDVVVMAGFTCIMLSHGPRGTVVPSIP